MSTVNIVLPAFKRGRVSIPAGCAVTLDSAKGETENRNTLLQIGSLCQNSKQANVCDSTNKPLATVKYNENDKSFSGVVLSTKTAFDIKVGDTTRASKNGKRTTDKRVAWSQALDQAVAKVDSAFVSSGKGGSLGESTIENIKKLSKANFTPDEIASMLSISVANVNKHYTK